MAPSIKKDLDAMAAFQRALARTPLPVRERLETVERNLATLRERYKAHLDRFSADEPGSVGFETYRDRLGAEYAEPQARWLPDGTPLIADVGDAGRRDALRVTVKTLSSGRKFMEIYANTGTLLVTPDVSNVVRVYVENQNDLQVVTKAAKAPPAELQCRARFKDGRTCRRLRGHLGAHSDTHKKV